MRAYDAGGRIVGSAVGESVQASPAPKDFAIAAPGIVRVEIKTDNRSGNSALARWSSLPVVAFGFDR